MLPFLRRTTPREERGFNGWICPNELVLTVNLPLKYNPNTQEGPVAQLGARINRTDEVAGSNPARSTRAWAHGAAGSAPQWH